MEPNSPVSTPVAAPVRLSCAQKRDLFGQTVAAIITTAIIAAPIVNQAIGTAPPVAVRVPEVLAAATPIIPVNGATGLPAIPGAATTSRTSPHSSARRGAAAVLGTSLDTAVAARAAARKPLGRRITGWLTGDGTRVVRPFPTVARP